MSALSAISELSLTCSCTDRGIATCRQRFRACKRQSVSVEPLQIRTQSPSNRSCAQLPTCRQLQYVAEPLHSSREGQVSGSESSGHGGCAGGTARVATASLAVGLAISGPASAAALPVVDLQHLPVVLASIGDMLYGVGQQADVLVQQQLAGVSPATFLVVFGAGLLTSLSPCTLSVLPLTIGYIGGYSTAAPGTTTSSAFGRSVSFALGLATTLAVLGGVSTYVGKAYGSIGNGLPVAVSVVAIVMGLNLLEVVPLRLPSLDVDVRQLSLPPLLQAYLAGLTFALAASPCSTPVLATLLAYVTTTRDPVLGGGLLLAYTTGYVGPLLVAAAFTGALTRILALRQWSAWITPASGVLLLSGGTYGLLTRLVP